MKYAIIFSILLLGCVSQQAPQTDKQIQAIKLQSLVKSHQVATWKYNARGAYSVIFDDYCLDGVTGIQDHAAPEAEKRGLVIGFGVVTGFCDANEWQRAREMIAAGHEIINHSHTHRCGELRKPWCVDIWHDEDVDEEIDQPANLIEANTGVRPEFFIFPFDLFTRGKVNHLRGAGYLGTRTGDKKKLTSAHFKDPFAELNFDVKFPPESRSSQGFGLNEYVDQAIAKGQFAFRELHGVEDQSWGSLPLKELLNHFDYLETKVKTHQLWMAGISEIIRYNQARRLCSLHSGVDEQGAWIMLWGDLPVCREGVELSLVFSTREQLQLTSRDNQSIGQINGTYTLRTGEAYHIAAW